MAEKETETSNDSQSNWELRYKVESSLKWGIIFSIIWLFGFGSLISVILAARARTIIINSNGQISGMGKVWWCFILGGIGMVMWFPIVIIGIMNHL